MPGVGDALDGYRLDAVLGRGGMGTVYRATDRALEKTVALKLIAPHLVDDETFVRRFREEAKALARLDADGIVDVYTLRETEQALFFVMEYVAGPSLDDVLRRRGALPPESGLELLRQVLTAVGHAHASGVLHRDLKPSNILLHDGEAVITDFGLAKILASDADLTATHEQLGTVAYMAPEQIEGLRNVDERSDLFSLGLIAYEVFTGRLPFDRSGSDFSIQRAIVDTDFPPPSAFAPAVPPAVETVVMDLLTKDPAARLLDTAPEQAAGRPWWQVLTVHADAQATLREWMEAPRSDRAPVRVSLCTDDGTSYRVDVEVRPDPRDEARRILVLHDVTEVHALRRLLDDQDRFHDLVGQSAPMQDAFQQIQSVAGVKTTVLIQGETGTGKELAARAIHDESPRADGPFVPVNCAALHPDLAGSRLFGHRMGAFTGATDDREGFFEAADGGTLFLDEIGDVPLDTQRQLLRVFEEEAVTRLGETESRPVDVRIVAATHRNLDEEVEADRFRQDLLYRIRIARVTLPPLRNRQSDLPLLVRTFLREIRARTGAEVTQVSDAALRHLLDYDWPGNVRELRNALEAALIRASGTVLRADDLPPELRETSSDPPRSSDNTAERIRAALAQTNGNRTDAANLLGISRATLYRRLDEYDIE